MVKKLKHHISQSQFLKFLFVGAINTLFGYTIFSALIYCGIHYTIAILLATCLGVLFNFQTTGRYVFNNNNRKLLLRFIAVYIILYFINVSIIKFSNYFIDNIYMSGGVATIAVAFIAFFLNKYVVFQSIHYEKN